MQKLAEFIVRPTRRVYNPESDLGPKLFTIDQKYYCSRTDFEVRNRRYKNLKCSLFHHNANNNASQPLIMFCHGNSGNRTYSYEIVSKMLQAHIAVLTFDFAGCGLSEGKYVFQGLFEQFDIEDVLEHTIKEYTFIDRQRIGIWGRSMGAIAALLFASHNYSASLIIVDSPFKDFSDVVNEYMSRFKIIPNVFARYISSNLRQRILHTAGFDFEELKPIESIATCKTPALFHHGKKDQVVPNYHSRDLFDAYPAEKELVESEGGHNTNRTNDYYDTVLKFIKAKFARRRSIFEGGLANTVTLQPCKNVGEQDQENWFDVEYEAEAETAKIQHKLPTKSMRSNDLLKMRVAVKQSEGLDTSKEESQSKEDDGQILHQEQSELGEDFVELHYQSIAFSGGESNDENDCVRKTKNASNEGINDEELNSPDNVNHSRAENNFLDETKRDNNLIINEKDEIISIKSNSSHYARIEDDEEDMSLDLSNIMSEPDLISTMKPWKEVRIKSTQNILYKNN